MVYSELRRLFLTFRDKNSSSNMKIDTLSFLNTILIHHQPAVFLPHIKILVPVRVLDQSVSSPGHYKASLVFYFSVLLVCID